jgi:MAP/microtubule affinity-regulating kinase
LTLINGKIIGKGACGIVRLAYDENNQKIAIKRAHPDVYSSSMLMKEYRLLKTLDHPNIIKPVKLNIKETDVSVILPYYKYDLFRFINRFGNLDDYDVQLFIKAIASALKHAHDKNIVHLDIKPGNILLEYDVSQCILADWGSSNLEDEIEQMDISGTNKYTSPEMYGNKTLKTKYKIGKPVDVYSLGATVYVLMTSLPLTDRTNDKNYIPTQAEIDTLIKNLHCLSMLKNLLIGMLQIEPSKRMTVDDILKHPFVICDLETTNMLY